MPNKNLNIVPEPKQETIGIIGGGVSGLTIALALSDAGYLVTIIDSLDSLLKGTSSRHSYREHLGFHYPGDPSGKTARACIEGAIAFEQSFPGFTSQKNGWYNMLVKEAVEADLNHGVNRGSLIDEEEFIRYCDTVCDIYREVIKESPEKALFGLPQDLYRIVPATDYQHLINDSRVSFCIESKERVIDSARFGAYLCEEIAKRDNIVLLLAHNVVGVEQQDGGFTLTLKTENQLRHAWFNQVVNAAWTGGPYLDSLIGAKQPKSTLRLRYITHVSLPPELANEASMFFSLGEYGNYTNLGVDAEGGAEGALFYVPVSDAAKTEHYHLPEQWQYLLKNGLDWEQQVTLGKKIINGLAEFVPSLSKSRIKQTKVASVITQGDVDINNIDSDIHRRDEAGVRMIVEGWHSVNVAKLTYCVTVMQQVVRSVSRISSTNYNP